MKKHATVSEDYEKKLKDMSQQHEDFMEGLNMRREY